MTDPLVWRLIRSAPADGAWNMAADEAILEAAAAGCCPPTLRLYAWTPPTLSLGYTQPAADADPAAIARLGWGFVRRPTGGRAILHTDELTYSVAGREDDPLLAGGVLESYRRLSRGLLAGLRLLGVEASANGKHGARAAGGAVCFEVPSDYEITAGGKKLVGSAQSRRLGGVLQHGTIPLTGDLARILQALAAGHTTPAQVRARAATLAEVLGRAVEWSEAADAIARGFTEEFGIAFTLDDLSAEEEAQAGVLAREKYGNDAWTRRI